MTPETLQERYDRLCRENLDISDHLPTLLALGKKCPRIVELGVRYGASTTALLLAAPESLILVDIQPCQAAVQEIKRLAQVQGKTRVEFFQADSRKIALEPMDLLFIDTEHTYKCLIKELMLHGPQCSQYIALHDTVLFPALMRAVKEFLESHPFRVRQHYPNNNGLTILERIKK